MSKEKFIIEVEAMIAEYGLSEEAMAYFESIKLTETKPKKRFTENGVKILQFMQENEDAYKNLFKSKNVAEGIFITSRGVSGSMRKLVADGYVEKIGDSPVVYALTETGRGVDATIDVE